VTPFFSRREVRLIEAKDVCRLSTISSNGWPHSVPVGYVYHRGKFYVPSSKDAKKVVNLARNAKATLVIDDELKEHGVMIECTARVLRGLAAERLIEHMRNVKGWKNDNSTVVIELSPIRKASWFLK
jgi:nitroimidazol reductase NimA-like FMN-containing flavoprotein (pyridoxamine 5'-phosphate oxidase superfamily)